MLSGSFTGETATRWQDKFDEVSTQGNELMEAVGAIGDFLKQAADTLEQTDQELAANICRRRGAGPCDEQSELWPRCGAAIRRHRASRRARCSG